MQFSGRLGRRIARFWTKSHNVLIAIAMAWLVGPAASAQVPSISTDQLQQLQQQRSNNTVNTAPSVTTRETILEPTAPTAALPTSPLETLLSARAGTALHQFGYDQLGVGRSVNLPQVGAMQDDYVLGVGDEVVLTLRGQENAEYRTEVNRDGSVTFPKLNPISAAGRSFGQLRADLLAAIHRAYVSTEGFVTVGHLRQISVLVSGEVGSPGVRTLTGLSTVADAIFVSGGVLKSGSLRNIRILRGGRELAVDLYSILIGGIRSRNITLADGDKIIVPPIGATVAITGEARRPGIYELPPGRSSISIREAVALASGTTVPGSYTVSLLRTAPDGRRQFLDVTNAPATVVGDGEVVFVKMAVNISLNQVTLLGSVRTPGLFALNRYPTLHDLLPSADVLKPGTYMLIGIIDRTDPATMQRIVLPFSPLRVIQGKENVRLASDDIVRILTRDDMRTLIAAINTQQSQTGRRAAPATAAPAPGTPADGPNAALAARAEAALAGTPAGGVNAAPGLAAAPGGAAAPAAGVAAPAGAAAPAGDPGSDAGGDSGFFGRALSELRINIDGAVRDPGLYLVAPGTSLSDLVTAAGGFTADVDLSTLELTSTQFDNTTGTSTTSRTHFAATPEALNAYVLKPLDDIVFRRVYSNAETGAFITIRGEVRNPGTYAILRNERLSSVIERAGGLTPQAFPYGAVFTRVSVADREQEAHMRSANDLRSQLVGAIMRPTTSTSNTGITGDTMTAILALLTQIESQPAIGRVSVIPDPDYLRRNPSADILLEPGDTVTIPRRPSTVTVLGEVLQPGTFIWNDSNDVSDYVDQAGGLTEFADSSRIIVILPDGSARSAGMSWLSLGLGSDVPPGSVIVVFRDVSSLSSHQLIIEVTSIMSQLASTAAAMAVLSKY